MVIFGATGDLSQRKLMPALYNLQKQDCLDPCFAIIGVGRAEIADSVFRGNMRDAVTEHSGETVSAAEWKTFEQRLSYLRMDVTDLAAFRMLATQLSAPRSSSPNDAATVGNAGREVPVGDGPIGNHLFYLAVPPDVAPEIVAGLQSAGLNRQSGESWRRIVVEKPFGRDLASGRALNRVIAGAFDEDQVFRIDHFLGKETVQNLLAFRFANTLFEPVWNRNYIDHVQITAAETIGIGHRAGSYEQTGALRDMVANHLLQMLTLTTMEPPYAFDATAVREEKVQVLRSIQPMTAEEVVLRTVRGQYGAGKIDGLRTPGYRAEAEVAKGSNVETYAALKLGIDNWRWADVPFYLRAGKRMSRYVSEIAVHFKRTPQAVFRHVEGVVPRNAVIFRIQPGEGIGLTFSAKVPGQGMETARVRMSFDYQSAFGVDIPAAYETLLLDVMEGDATLFTRADEAEAQWSIVTPILEAWDERDASEFPNYAAGTDGPKAGDELLARDGRAWRPLDALEREVLGAGAPQG